MKLKTLSFVIARTLEARLRSALGLPLRPYKALLELTSECNSRCTTCDIWKTPFTVKAAEIQLPEVQKILREFGNDLVWLALSGGEVTLVAHFPEVIDLAKKLCPNLALITFTTNGLLPQKALEYAKYIRRQNIDLFVTVSLDGDQETHDRIRGVLGNYGNALLTLKLLKDEGIDAHYGITLGDLNQDFVKNRFKDYRDEIKAVTFVASHGIYRKENAVDDSGVLKSLKIVLENYNITSAGQWIEWLYLRLAVIFLGSGRKTHPIPCDVLKTSVHIRPNGDVLPCMFMPAVGNIRQSSWKEILASPKTTASLKEIQNSACPRCWMNCYAPHSIMSRPLLSIFRALIAPLSKTERGAT